MICEIPELYKSTIIKRPSATCKTPYVGDGFVVKKSQPIEQTMVHCPALGCCGLCEKDSCILVSPIPAKKGAAAEKQVCNYRSELALCTERSQTQIIGINPKLAEIIVNNCLTKNYFHSLQNLQSFKREVTYLNSRFDFAGTDENGIEFILEVKNVPLADYEDCLEKEKKKMDFSDRPYNSKISYFPDGYRKKVKDTVSPRALKHIKELQELVIPNKRRAIICYVIQRTDVASFQPSKIDPIYRNAVIEAHKSGVEIIPLVCKWSYDEKTCKGICEFVTDKLPINL